MCKYECYTVAECNIYVILKDLSDTAINTLLCLSVYYLFFNQPEIPHNIIEAYFSPQFCSLMIETITWNLLNDYSK